MMRGAIAVQEMFGLVLLVLVAVVFFYGLSNNFSFLDPLFGCPDPGEPIPAVKFWCKHKPVGGVSTDSLKALACAINSVGGSTSPSDCPGGNQEVQAGFGVSAQSDETCFGKACVTYSSGVATVTEFELPEDFGGLFSVGTAEEYIAGFGNPSQIVRPGYQAFPRGEDVSWTGYAAWWSGVGEAVLWAIPGSKAFKTLWKGGKSVLGISTRIISFGALGRKSGKAKTLEKIGNQVIKDAKGSVGGVARVLEEKNIVLIEEGVAFAAKRTVIRRIYRNRVNKEIVKRFKTFDEYIDNVNPDVLSKVTEPGFKNTDEFVAALRSSYEKVAGMSDDIALKIEQEIAEETLDLSKYLTEGAQTAIANDVFKDVSQTALKKTIAATGIVSIASYIATRAECEEFKSQNVPDKLVLSEPLNCEFGESYSEGLENAVTTMTRTAGEGSDTITVEMGKPIALEKGWHEKIIVDFGNKPTPFYLVSPCSGTVTVEEEDVTCDYYEYTDEGKLNCINPDFTDSGLTCGYIFGVNELSTQLMDMITPPKQRLFEYVNNKLEEIHVPLGGRDDKRYYLTNIEKLDSCSPYSGYGKGQKIQHWDDEWVNPPYACYNADIVDEDTGEIVMKISESNSVEEKTTRYFICGRGGTVNTLKPSFYQLTGHQLVPDITYCILEADDLFRGSYEHSGANGEINFIVATATEEWLDQTDEDMGLYSQFITMNNMHVMLNDDTGEGFATSVGFSTGPRLYSVSYITNLDDDSDLDKIQTIKLEDGLPCTIPGMKVSVEKDDTDPNFCYTRESVGEQVLYSGLIAGSLFGSFLFGGITGGVGTAVGIGITQGAIAYFVSNQMIYWPN